MERVLTEPFRWSGFPDCVVFRLCRGKRRADRAPCSRRTIPGESAGDIRFVEVKVGGWKGGKERCTRAQAPGSCWPTPPAPPLPSGCSVSPTSPHQSTNDELSQAQKSWLHFLVRIGATAEVLRVTYSNTEKKRSHDRSRHFT